MTLLLRHQAELDESWGARIDQLEYHDPRWHTFCSQQCCTQAVATPLGVRRDRPRLPEPDVVLLQQLLNSAGANIAVDGVYGAATAAAVRTWKLLRRRDATAADRSATHRGADRTASP